MAAPRLRLVSFRGPSRSRPLPSRRGLVCAGGGITGAIYEIGVLAALEDRLDGFSLTDCDVFVGVSAGAYVGSLVANGASPSVLYRNATHPRAEGLDRLTTLAGRKRVAVLCGEPMPWRCHRSLIATTLTARGWRVWHLMTGAEPRLHELGAWGATPHVDAAGVVTYPA